MSHQFSHSFYGGFVSLLNGNVEKIKDGNPFDDENNFFAYFIRL